MEGQLGPVESCMYVSRVTNALAAQGVCQNLEHVLHPNQPRLLVTAGRNSVIHVTESFGGGVAEAIKDYVRNAPTVDHHLIYTPRRDSPIAPSDLAVFVSTSEMGFSHIGRISNVRRRLMEFDEVTIHCHSSFGGAYARMAVKKSAKRRIVYTPHCYSFERRDIGSLKRTLFRLVEWFLAMNTTVIAGCSEREVRLSRWPMARARIQLLPNVFSPTLGEVSQRKLPGGILRVAGAGRLGTQKDPTFFADCVKLLRASGVRVSATWIGGGDPEIESALRQDSIDVTGWLSRSEVERRFLDTDVYIHSAQWEGFPLVVIESAAMRITTVVRSIPAFEDLPESLKLEHALPQLIKHSSSDASLNEWRARNIELWQDQLRNNSDDYQAQALADLYQLPINASL